MSIDPRPPRIMSFERNPLFTGRESELSRLISRQQPFDAEEFSLTSLLAAGGQPYNIPATSLTPDLATDDTSHYSTTMSRSTSMDYLPGGQPYNILTTSLTPDLATHDTSHYSSTVSRSTSMVYLPEDLNSRSLNSGANDSFTSYKTQLSHVGTSFDNPIMSPSDQDTFQPQTRYSLSSNFCSQDIIFPPLHYMQRSLSAASSSSGIHEAPISNMDHPMPPSYGAMPQTTSPIAEEEPQSASSDKSVGDRSRKAESARMMVIPHSNHIIPR
jgi:hypothetical protein